MVLDLDADVTFTPAGEHAFKLHGLSGGSAVMNAQPRDAPLTRVVLTPDGDDTTLSFETSAAVTANAFPVSAGGNGGHRFVVDLYKVVKAPVAAEAERPPAPSQSVTTSVSVSTFSARGPAVPAVAPVARSVAPPPTVSPPNAYAAVPPSNPPQIGPTPYEVADAQVPAAETNAAPNATPTIASAPPTNTIPFGGAGAQQQSATGAASLSEIQSTVATNSAPPGDTISNDHALLAERALDRGDAKTACAAATDALHSAPQDLRALAVLGSCQLALGDAVSARATFSSALAIDPSYHRARIGLAQTDIRQGDVAGARQEYQRVLADNPPTDETYKILDALQALEPPGAMTAAGLPQGT